MIVSLRYITEKFRHFNELLFHGALEPPRFALSRARTCLGLCTYTKNRKGGAPTAPAAMTLKLSTAFDLPESEWDDVLIHEMIHCYIAQKGLRDTSAHGRVFRSLMNDFNQRHSRHISITRKIGKQGLPQPKPPKGPFVVAIVRFNDGRVGIKVLPRILQRVEHYYHTVLRNGMVSSVRVVATNDIFFSSYPKSSALRIHYIDENILREHLTDAQTIK